MSMPPVLQASAPELVTLARTLMGPGQRRVLGIVGTPGAGKSTLCAALMAGLGQDAALVPMDGFHLANQELERLGRRNRKGAPDTFDADGYAALLERLRQPQGRLIYAPLFDRQLEESIGSALPVPPGAPLIITEGNYLLLQEGEWGRVRAALDTVWFLEVPEALRLERLVRRHQQFGKSAREAEQWVQQVDQRNAEVIRATRSRADLIVQLTETSAQP
ncbi:nucleoside/nucleotide kinase family protein [Deinococcus sonorensis]|uniref:Nucleoside/nucleotide kinase family protein n=2 Tax=Deinococcus sonorensis TaxID=309891 RepID=A0AAU7UDV9_9DEIO